MLWNLTPHHVTGIRRGCWWWLHLEFPISLLWSPVSSQVFQPCSVPVPSWVVSDVSCFSQGWSPAPRQSCPGRPTVLAWVSWSIFPCQSYPPSLSLLKLGEHLVSSFILSHSLFPKSLWALISQFLSSPHTETPKHPKLSNSHCRLCPPSHKERIMKKGNYAWGFFIPFLSSY